SVVGARLVADEPAERKEEEPQRKERDESNVGPPLGEVCRHLQEAPGSEHGPARAQEALAERDVEQRSGPDQDPVEVAAVEEPEEPSTDRQARHDVEPEAVDPR